VKCSYLCYSARFTRPLISSQCMLVAILTYIKQLTEDTLKCSHLQNFILAMMTALLLKCKYFILYDGIFANNNLVFIIA